MWPFSVEKGEPGPVEGCHRHFKLATNNSISHHEHVLYRLKLGYEPINRALDFGRNGAHRYASVFVSLHLVMLTSVAMSHKIFNLSA
jgi:hypothetical protein